MEMARPLQPIEFYTTARRTKSTCAVETTAQPFKERADVVSSSTGSSGGTGRPSATAPHHRAPKRVVSGTRCPARLYEPCSGQAFELSAGGTRSCAGARDLFP